MSAASGGVVVQIFPEKPRSYIESFMTLVFSYRRAIPPDELTRELAYRMLRQKMALLKVVEYENAIYVVALQRGKIVMFEIHPPQEEDEDRKFRGWWYRTVRDPRDMPREVLRESLRPFVLPN